VGKPRAPVSATLERAFTAAMDYETAAKCYWELKTHGVFAGLAAYQLAKEVDESTNLQRSEELTLQTAIEKVIQFGESEESDSIDVIAQVLGSHAEFESELAELMMNEICDLA